MKKLITPDKEAISYPPEKISKKLSNFEKKTMGIKDDPKKGLPKVTDIAEKQVSSNSDIAREPKVLNAEEKKLGNKPQNAKSAKIVNNGKTEVEEDQKDENKVKQFQRCHPEEDKFQQVEGDDAERIIRFWYVKNKIPKINQVEYFEFLKSLGIMNYYPESGRNDLKPILIQVINNQAEPINQNYIIRITSEYLLKNKKKKFLNAYLGSINSIVNEKSLSSLSAFEGEFNRDTKDKAFFYFKNVIAEVSQDGIKSLNYMDLKGIIWKSQIIDKVFTIKNTFKVLKNCVFHSFLKDITSHKDKKKAKKRYLHLLSIIGYLLHDYKDETFAKAVVLMDEKVSDEASGGTGKTLLARSLGKLRKVVQEDGKSFNPDDRFVFQQVMLDTQIFQVDDTKKNFNFERLFAVITEGLQVEKKGEPKFTIPYANSPKILITTNYVVGDKADSADRRREEFELTNFYHSGFGPDTKYKHQFFLDWDDNQWNLYFNLMLVATKSFLKNKIMPSEPINTEYKRLVNKVGEEIIEFIENEVEIGVEHDKNKLFNKFLIQYPNVKIYHQRSFTNCIKEYASIKGLILDKRHSGNINYLTFSNPNSPQ